jgi:hypothetical protein
MKITLKANNEIHRQIAKMFVGIWVGFPTNNIKGLFQFVDRDYFLISGEMFDEITIDLSEAEMDLRLAIGTRIEFLGYGVLLACDDVWGYFDREFEETCLLRNLKLSTDYLDRIGVEVEE